MRLWTGLVMAIVGLALVTSGLVTLITGQSHWLQNVGGLIAAICILLWLRSGLKRLREEKVH